jgi:hypothetical protein
VRPRRVANSEVNIACVLLGCYRKRRKLLAVLDSTWLGLATGKLLC